MGHVARLLAAVSPPFVSYVALGRSAKDLTRGSKYANWRTPIVRTRGWFSPRIVHSDRSCSFAMIITTRVTVDRYFRHTSPGVQLSASELLLVNI